MTIKKNSMQVEHFFFCKKWPGFFAQPILIFELSLVEKKNQDWLRLYVFYEILFPIDNQLDIVIAFMTLNVKLNVKPFTGGNIQLRFKNDIVFKFEERVM